MNGLDATVCAMVLQMQALDEEYEIIWQSYMYVKIAKGVNF